MSMPAELPVIGDLKLNALEYAASGLEVFPVAPSDDYEWMPGQLPKGAKAPIVSQYQATTDTKTIIRWWDRWPDALIGHRLPADQLVIDVDPRHGGDDTWRRLRDELDFDTKATRVHISGRGDGGGHVTYLHPGGRLTIRKLDQWAKQRGVGEAIENTEDKWVCGLDILHRTHRYTILPPSPHPETGQPYRWHQWTEPTEMPPALAELLIDTSPPPPPYEPKEYDGDSIADWFSETKSWNDILPPHGWSLRAGNGDEDGSQWRHPGATSAVSATTRHGCLFVYSPNTPFEVTEENNPHGVTRFAAFTELDHDGDATAAARAARELKDGPRERRKPEANPFGADYRPPVEQTEDPTADDEVEETPEADEDDLPTAIDWPTFWAREAPEEDWLVEPLLARGRQTALFAAAKVGKSLLMLEVAAALATGKSALSQPAGEPMHVVYADYEMTADDLYERLEALGYGPDVDLSHLHYYLLPSLRPLNTDQGGWDFVRLCERDGAEAAVIDTFGRSLQGEENANDTYNDFYRFCGLRLKQRGIALARLDHAGKDATKGQRGGSAKSGDVDIVWQLEPVQDGVKMRRTHARMSWVPEAVTLLRKDEGRLHHVVTEGGGGYPAGTKEAAELLERLGIPADESARQAGRRLSEVGEGRRSEVIRGAQKFRRAEALRGWTDERN